MQELGRYIRALHCSIRWTIINLIRDDSKSKKQIYEFLTGCGEKLTFSGVPYNRWGRNYNRRLKTV